MVLKNKKMTGIFILFAVMFILPVVSAVIIWSDGTGVDFTTITDPSIPTCVYPYWYENDDIVPSFNDCYRINANPPDCCPSSYACNATHQCERCVGNLRCYNYTTEDECNEDRCNVGEITVNEINSGYNNYCGISGDPYHKPEYETDKDGDGDIEKCIDYVRNCSCVWHPDANNGVGGCGADNEWAPVCNDTPNPQPSYSSCKRDFTEITNCSGGYRFERLTGYYVSGGYNPLTCNVDADCESKFDTEGELPDNLNCKDDNGIKRCISDDCKPLEKSTPCLISELSFFGIVGAIVLILLIIIFYLLVMKKRKKFRQAREIKSAGRKVRRKKRR